VRVFLQKFTPEDAIEIHAFAPFEASKRVTNGIRLGLSLLSYRLTLVNSVQTLKASSGVSAEANHELCHTPLHGLKASSGVC
jgi:hypothetical protein